MAPFGALDQKYKYIHLPNNKKKTHQERKNKQKECKNKTQRIQDHPPP